MFASSWLRQLQRRWFPRRPMPRTLVRRVRPCLEVLEDRTLPAVFNVGAGDVAGLIADINQANSNGQTSNTINLTAGTYNLTEINNYWYGPDGLPAITSNLTINGDGATIQHASSAQPFRLFYVSNGRSGLPLGTLTLNNLTLQDGVARGGDGDEGGGGLGAGGAIFNQGVLNLFSVTLMNNQAVGGNSGVSNTTSVGTAGGGGMGQNALFSTDPTANGGRDGGGFGGALIGGPFGGSGGSAGTSGGGGGGGFLPTSAGVAGTGNSGGAGGGTSGLGGAGGGGGPGGDGGGGGSSTQGVAGGGGNFGNGGVGGTGGTSGLGGDGGGGGGGVGGGGGGSSFGGGGGGGFGGGGGAAVGTGGTGGFGGGGGFGRAAIGGSVFGGGNGSGGSATAANVGGGGGAGMGGAIFNMFGTANLTNCTLAGNMALGGNSGGAGAGAGAGLGGAIFNLDGTLNLTFCTIANNSVFGGTSGGTTRTGSAAGAAVYNLAIGNSLSARGVQTATTNLTDSILSNSSTGPLLVNTLQNGANVNTATVTLIGPNRVTLPPSSGVISGDTQLALAADPGFGPTAMPVDNGGLTPTLALPTGSPMIAAGRAVPTVSTDQRGVARPITPSLGAFQFVPPPPAPPAPRTFSSVQITSVSNRPGLVPGDPIETISVHVTGASGGTVTFTLDGQSVSAAVDANGNATVTLDLPLLAVILPQSITTDYNGASSSSSTTTTAFWNLLDALLPALDTFLADGTQLLQFSFFGIPLVFLIDAPSGQLEGVGLGVD
jgi:hypothetical protein